MKTAFIKAGSPSEILSTVI